jgi:hypothetical protein
MTQEKALQALCSSNLLPTLAFIGGGGYIREMNSSIVYAP